MAAFVRTNKEAKRIYYKVMGKPAFEKQNKTAQQKHNDMIVNQRLIYTNPIYGQFD